MDSPPEQRVLQRYLDRLEQWLSMLPETDRAEMLQEVRQHILALAAAHGCQPDAPIDAMRRALREFGKADTIGLSLLDAWLKRRAEQAQALHSPRIKKRRLLIEAFRAAAMAAMLTALNSASFMYCILGLVVSTFAINGLEKRLLPGDSAAMSSTFDFMFRQPFRNLSLTTRVRLSSKLETALTGKSNPTSIVSVSGVIFAGFGAQWVHSWPSSLGHENIRALAWFGVLFMSLFFIQAAGIVYKPSRKF